MLVMIGILPEGGNIVLEDGSIVPEDGSIVLEDGSIIPENGNPICITVLRGQYLWILEHTIVCLKSNRSRKTESMVIGTVSQTKICKTNHSRQNKPTKVWIYKQTIVCYLM